MLFLKRSTAIAIPTIVASWLLLLSSMPVLADLSMKPRTCSNCSGFSGQSSLHHHRPSPGITGHKSFGHQGFKSYRPQTYDSFKHSGKRHYHRDKQNYRDYRPRFDGNKHHYQPHYRQHHNGISLGIVAPIIYSTGYNNNVVPRTYSPAPVTRTTTPSRNVPGQNIDAWAALGNYQTDAAKAGFVYQSQLNPQNALPKVGNALATAVAGDYEQAAWAMDLALAANVTDLHYFQVDANMQLVLEDMLMNYSDQSLMRATILYLQQDYQNADDAIKQSLNDCRDCRGEQNLQALIERKSG